MKRLNRQQLVIIYTVVFLGLMVALVVKGFHKGGVYDADRSNDFRAYHLAAQAVWQGDLVPAFEDDARPFQYPPPFAYLVAPLGLVPYRLGVSLWVLINAALVVTVFRRMDKMLGLAFSSEAKLAGFFLAFRMVESDFSNGNANVLVLSLVMISFDLLRRRRDLLSGVSLGAACLAKVSPIVLVPWMLYKRRWRVLGGVAIVWLVLGGLLPFLLLGPENCRRAWGAWGASTLSSVDVTSARYREEPGQGYVPGQSLRALLHRVLRDADATAHDDDVISIHLLDLSKRSAEFIYYVVGAGVFVLVVLGFRYRNPGLSHGWAAGELAAACVLIPLLGPLSRKAHFVFLWPAAVVGFEAWWRAEGRLKWVGGALWGTALVLVVGTSSDIVGRSASTLLLAYCPYTWAALFLLVLVLYPGFYPRSARRMSGELTSPSSRQGRTPVDR